MTSPYLERPLRPLSQVFEERQSNKIVRLIERVFQLQLALINIAYAEHNIDTKQIAQEALAVDKIAHDASVEVQIKGEAYECSNPE